MLWLVPSISMIVYASSGTLVTYIRALANSIVDHTFYGDQLFAKRSKCPFESNFMEYLGHYIPAARVSTDRRKIEVVVKWPIPTNIK